MTTYTAIPAGDVDADSPITTGLITKLRDNPIAITEGSAGAPQIKPGLALDPTVTSDGTQSVAASGTWTPTAGYYQFSATITGGTGISNQIFVSGAWRDDGQAGAFMQLFDGTNMRFINNNGSASRSVYYQKLDG